MATSAIGTKRTFQQQPRMTAFGIIADIAIGCVLTLLTATSALM
jgi:hypothetical protein